VPKTKTYFGIAVPPFKHQKFKVGGLTLRFVVQASTIPSKKNNKWTKVHRGRSVNFLKDKMEKNGAITYQDAIDALDLVYGTLVPNREWGPFVDQQRPLLIQQMAFYSKRFKDRGLIFPLSKCGCNAKLYYADKYQSDNDNKMISVHDLFVEAGVISDDNFFVFNPTNSVGAYHEEIPQNIIVVDLTVFEDMTTANPTLVIE
jgi:hypothetical protein